jgi:hypothetical protein
VPALLLLLFGIVRGWQPGCRAQGHVIVACGVLGMLCAASLPQVIVFQPRREAGFVIATVLSLLLAALLWRERRREGAGAEAVLVMVLAGMGTWLLTLAIWRLMGSEGATWWNRGGADMLPRLCSALVFIAFWGVVSWLALRAGRRGLFVLSFAVIAIRVFILYWEAFGGLLNTGLGLIGGGLLCLAMAALGWHIARRAGVRVEAAI